MPKLFNHRIYVVIIAIVIILAISFLVRHYTSTREIHAYVGPLDIEVGVPVSFADSTTGADHWLWEFGNGDTSPEQRGQYIFSETGKYQIRLTVNGELEKRFIVNVRPTKKDDDLQLIKIIAPQSALQGEFIIFRGEGTSKEWRWEFGETGKVDAHEKTAIYQYNEPGSYEIALRTEETKYPIIHTIEIIPQYMDNDSTDVATIIGNDIKEKLQAIVDQKPFNTSYNYVMSTYLCNNPNTLVIINNSKKNDFYSYCQGLKIIGRKSTIIEKVLIDIEESQSCINKLIVIQTDIN
ncbi:PKD domain-containing protein [Dysgonomonas sp. ZJ709]|uniref:PKD domain-containing protein n=1 Tax=Dysgonomonas sp. ZJ709 TaxID=2709797 RepID=UPI0013EABBB5|nr:PKD domain-containing protein [Dysgonomonas sp. ZJ709]